MLLRVCLNKTLYCLSFIMLLFVLSPHISSPAVPGHKPPIKTFEGRLQSQVYTVKKGDTLYKISKKFNIEVEKIKNANSLKTGELKPGSKLTIPGHASVKQSAKQHETQYHTVKKGETLASISK